MPGIIAVPLSQSRLFRNGTGSCADTYPAGRLGQLNIARLK